MSEEKVLEAEELETEVIKQTPTNRAIRKIGRNESCPCGSEKKYKRCCIGIMDHYMYNVPLIKFNYPTFTENVIEQSEDEQKKKVGEEQKITKLN